jgi:hypothetical protein
MPASRPHADHHTAENPHVKHSLKHAHDPSRPSTPPISFGNIYPRDDVIAVIDDREAADRARQALVQAGIPEDDVDVADAASVLEADQDFRQHRGAVERFQAWLSAAFSDDALDYRDYVHEAQRGHTLMMVHAQNARTVERVRQVLQAHGAHNMRYYGVLIVTDL